MKKGFTLVEIIISIGLILVIGTLSIVSFNFIKNKTNKIDDITNKIVEATNAYINIEVDDKGNTYKNGIYLGGVGVEIGINSLLSKGYISEDLYDELVSVTKKDSSELKLLVSVLSDNESDNINCDEGIIKYTVSWHTDIDEPIYLCNYNSDFTSSSNTIYGIIENRWKTDGKSGCIPNIDEGLCLISGNGKTNDGEIVYYFVGNNQNNYIKIGDEIFYIVRTTEDKNVKLISSSSFDVSFEYESDNTKDKYKTMEIFYNNYLKYICIRSLRIGYSKNQYDNYYYDYNMMIDAFDYDFKFIRIKEDVEKKEVKNEKDNSWATSWSDEVYIELTDYTSTNRKIYSIPHSLYKKLDLYYRDIRDKLVEYDFCSNSNGLEVLNFSCDEESRSKGYVGLLTLNEYYAILNHNNCISNENITCHNLYDNIGISYASPILSFPFTTANIIYDNIFAPSSSYYEIIMYPSVVIKGDSIITSGDGSKTSPYIIN